MAAAYPHHDSAASRYNKGMSQLEQIIAQIDQQKRPPVHLWRPSLQGEIDIEIDAQANWFHEGGQIKRPELVRLFSSILWHEDQQHFLVTPAEKLKIRVQDSPFVIQSAEYLEGRWVVTDNTAQSVIVGDRHPVSLREYQGQQLPYIKIRYDLWARVSRAVYYQWVTDAMNEGVEDDLALFSGDYEIRLTSEEASPQS